MQWVSPCLQVIPLPLVRRLALRKMRLTEEDDEDDEAEGLIIAANVVKGEQTHRLVTLRQYEKVATEWHLWCAEHLSSEWEGRGTTGQ
jgi:hypothetical protein